MLQTEFPFTLPKGYVDAEGNLHREGVMRLATAFDEIAPMKDPRVQSNPGYLVIILLSRVVTRLGTRSEERRVGEEFRSPGSPHLLKQTVTLVSATSARDIRI